MNAEHMQPLRERESVCVCVRARARVSFYVLLYTDIITLFLCAKLILNGLIKPGLL